MSDIVERIRWSSPYSDDGTMNSNNRLILEAADEIERLRAIVDRLPVRYAIRNDGSVAEGVVVWDAKYEGGAYVALGPTPSGVGDMRLAVSQAYETREAAEAAAKETR